MIDVGRELIGAAIIGGGFLAIFATAELWKRLADPPVEWTRKFVHFFGGLIAASFPWVFRSAWTVVALALVFLAIIWGTRRLGLLASVHGVERRSEGGIWYPLAVLAVFLIGRHQPVFYLIAILALVVSDTLAAIVGSAYGRSAYSVESDRRSIEGSAVFLLTTFLATHLPLLLMAGADPLLSVLVSIQIAIIVTQFEAISLRGNDNVLVPLVTYFLLVKMTGRSVNHIGEQLVAQLVIIVLIGLVAWRTRPLTFSGGLALMLFAYGVWSLGGPEWIVAPGLALLAFMGVRRLFAGEVPEPEGRYQVVAMFYVCIVATVLLLANNIMATMWPGAPPELATGAPLYVPYVGVVAAQLALILIAQLQPFVPGARAGSWRVSLSVAVAIVLVVPLGLIVGPRGLTPDGVILAASVPVAAAAVYVLGRALPDWPHRAPWNVRLQALAAAVVALPAVAVQVWLL